MSQGERISAMNLSILIVCDNREAQDTLGRLLASCGCRDVTVISDVSTFGKDFIKSGKDYDIALIDLASNAIAMVILNYLRKKRSRMETIVITGSDNIEFAVESTRNGAFEFLLKPFTVERLQRAIIAADEIRAIPRESIRILILEDDAVSGLLIKKYVADVGDSKLVTDGKKAIEEYRAALNERRPYHVVFLDIMVPEIHGRDVLQMIRKYENEMGVPYYRRAKIIMTSALGDAENIIDSFQSECDSYMIKPIDKKKLMKELERLGINCWPRVDSSPGVASHGKF
jgi:two-component system chemotaxis response regulator CheY